MRSAKHTMTLIAACGFALPALAQPLSPLSPSNARVERAAPSQNTAPRTPNFRGQFASMRDEFENYPVGVSLGWTGVSAPPTSTVVPDGFDWGLNKLRGQSVGEYVRVVDLAGSPVGSNATKALRIRTASAVDPANLFSGANLRWDTPLYPTADHHARVSADMYISTVAEQYTFEPVSGMTGSLVGRLLWGGTCVNTSGLDCIGFGLPLGPVPTIYTLSDSEIPFSTVFLPARFCLNSFEQPIAGCTPPVGFAVGDLVPPPIGLWSRFSAEVSVDFRVTYSIDYLNGQPEVAIASHPALAARIDRVQWNSSYESQGAFMIVDNFEASGPLYATIKPPTLECPYFDDIEWLETGLLLVQPPPWTAQGSSQLQVIDDGANGRVLSQTNIFRDNYHRREFSTELPHEQATLANDLVVSFDARFTGNTVRAFALFDGPHLVARVFNGHEDRTTPSNPVFTNSVFVQTDGAFNPIDSPFGSPNAVNPVIGQHIEDTGVAIPYAQYRTITLRLSASGALRVSVDGSLAYAGPAAFGRSVNTLAFESENNFLGGGAELRVDNIAMTCDAPSCATDFDFDDITSFSDLNAVLANFGASGLTGFTPGDANADGVVNFADLNLVLFAFGQSCD